MAKRKARAAKTRKTSSKRTKSTRPSRARSRGVAKPAKKRAPARKAARKKAAKKTKRVARPVARKVARKATARKAAARKPAAQKPVRARAAKAPAAAKKIPALNRARRTVQDDDVVPSPPSSLDLDRTASAARSGRREMHEHMDELTQTGPALTGGDVDADWESAYSVGDEVPGGDNQTPDQDLVDDIGRAIGVEYEDNEELKGDSKITKRDRHRWELDPASSDDYNDR